LFNQRHEDGGDGGLVQGKVVPTQEWSRAGKGEIRAEA